MTYKQALREFRRQYLKEMLIVCGYNITEVSRRSGIDRNSIYNYCYSLGIPLPSREEKRIIYAITSQATQAQMDGSSSVDNL